MKEFRDAHAHATGSGRKKFLIPILWSDIAVRELEADMKFYLENHTYIEYINLVMFLLFVTSFPKIMAHADLEQDAFLGFLTRFQSLVCQI